MTAPTLTHDVACPKCHGIGEVLRYHFWATCPECRGVKFVTAERAALLAALVPERAR